MPDPYLSIVEADSGVVERLADVLELRAADPQQREMLQGYLAQLTVPDGGHIIEVGCGTGAIARTIAATFRTCEIVGVDPSPVLLERARMLAAALPNLSFREGTGAELPADDGAFDLAIFHTSLCHMPEAEGPLREAYRALRLGGQIAVFDGDYATTTVALGVNDPLQPCVEHAIANLVHDPWIVRRLPYLLRQAGFIIESVRSIAYRQHTNPAYMLTLIDRGIDQLVASGQLGAESGEALKQEARRREREDRFFGQIVYGCTLATKQA